MSEIGKLTGQIMQQERENPALVLEPEAVCIQHHSSDFLLLSHVLQKHKQAHKSAFYSYI